eukprot:tig00000882_g5260.t1
MTSPEHYTTHTCFAAVAPAPHAALDGPAAWYAADFAGDVDQSRWILELDGRQRAELDEAVERVKREKGTEAQRAGWQHVIPRLTRSDFALPTLAPLLREIQEGLVHGKGFHLIRGLPAPPATTLDSALAFWAIGAHVGDAVPQNAQGHVLGHVRDLGADPSLPTTRIYTTREAQRFHTDSCDIVGLMCLAKAKEGGLSSWCSSVTVYNEMARRHPELVAELTSEALVWDRKGEIPAGKLAYYSGAVMNWTGEGQLSTIYDRSFFFAAQRFPEVPRLTERQVAAFEALEATCAREDVSLRFALEPGDVQLLHNHTTLHARSAFTDHAPPRGKRHLLRLWLSAPNGRPLSGTAFSERYGGDLSSPGALRGGIRTPGQEPYAPLDVDAG